VHRITKDIRPEDQHLTSSGPRNNSGNGLYPGVQSVREQTDYLYPGQELELFGPSTVYFRWVIDVLLIKNWGVKVSIMKNLRVWYYRYNRVECESEIGMRVAVLRYIMREWYKIVIYEAYYFQN